MKRWLSASLACLIFGSILLVSLPVGAQDNQIFIEAPLGEDTTSWGASVGQTFVSSDNFALTEIDIRGRWLEADGTVPTLVTARVYSCTGGIDSVPTSLILLGTATASSGWGTYPDFGNVLFTYGTGISIVAGERYTVEFTSSGGTGYIRWAWYNADQIADAGRYTVGGSWGSVNDMHIHIWGYANTVATVETAAAVFASERVVALGGTVTDLGSSTAVTGWLDWGTTDAYGNTKMLNTVYGTGSYGYIGGMFSTTTFTPGVTYHYRVRGVSVAGTGYGQDETFSFSANVSYIPGATLRLSKNTAQSVVLLATIAPGGSSYGPVTAHMERIERGETFAEAVDATITNSLSVTQTYTVTYLFTGEQALEGNTDYLFRVHVVDNIAGDYYSNIVSVLTYDTSKAPWKNSTDGFLAALFGDFGTGWWVIAGLLFLLFVALALWKGHMWLILLGALASVMLVMIMVPSMIWVIVAIGGIFALLAGGYAIKKLSGGGGGDA